MNNVKKQQLKLSKTGSKIKQIRQKYIQLKQFKAGHLASLKSVRFLLIARNYPSSEKLNNKRLNKKAFESCKDKATKQVGAGI